MLTKSKFYELLFEIASTANKVLGVEEFLSQALSLVAKSFGSEIGVIFLISDSQDVESDDLSLAAHLGIPDDLITTIQSLASSGDFFKFVLDSEGSIIIQNIKKNHIVIDCIRESGGKSLIATSLVFDKNTEGLVILAQKETTEFKIEDVAQLKDVVGIIAELIQGKRLNQRAISLNERKRLMRDLHDSVSQKLYGLVTLTEAAQAGLEAGSKINPAQILSKIGENARQAVKEMRLFLYEMEPVDLKQDGLVSALHHRLGAVEGRADVQARFFADDNINLSLDRQVGLYYIAQEALNNVLKHSHANQVSVKLERSKSKIILEVKDNGIGFDLEANDYGMGLRNMRDRAKQIKGDLDISSKPNAGTTVKVLLDEDI